MTREEAKKAAEVMMAYANGKEIEFFNGTTWIKASMPEFKWGIVDYRIKQESTYRPFKDKEECWNEMQKHHPVGWLIYDNKLNILSVDDVSVALDLDGLDYVNALTRLKFADSTPFGIKEDE